MKKNVALYIRAISALLSEYWAPEQLNLAHMEGKKNKMQNVV